VIAGVVGVEAAGGVAAVVDAGGLVAVVFGDDELPPQAANPTTRTPAVTIRLSGAITLASRRR
jgi:hypothetical protein